MPPSPGRPFTPLWSALVLVAALALGARPAAADIKLGYVDSARLFQEYPAAQEAQARFDRQVQGWRDEAAEKQKAVEELRREVRDQSAILSALRRQEKEEALQRGIADYEKFIQDVWGPNGRAQQANELATREVVDLIRAAVEKVAVDRDLDLVLDSSHGFIIYAEKTLDLTADVLQELQSRAGAPTGGR